MNILLKKNFLIKFIKKKIIYLFKIFKIIFYLGNKYALK